MVPERLAHPDGGDGDHARGATPELTNELPLDRQRSPMDLNERRIMMPEEQHSEPASGPQARKRRNRRKPAWLQDYD